MNINDDLIYIRDGSNYKFGPISLKKGTFIPLSEINNPFICKKRITKLPLIYSEPTLLEDDMNKLFIKALIGEITANQEPEFEEEAEEPEFEEEAEEPEFEEEEEEPEFEKEAEEKKTSKRKRKGKKTKKRNNKRKNRKKTRRL
jgi:hypothetical protein